MNKFKYVNKNFNPWSFTAPIEKYSGKLSIMMFPKQKPATPILYNCFLLNFLFDLFTHTVIVECDENDHRDYDTTCEIDKLNATFTDLADRPMVLIRFNPDKYEDKSCFDKDAKLIKNEWERRIKVLKKEVKKAIKEIPTELITRINLFKRDE